MNRLLFLLLMLPGLTWAALPFATVEVAYRPVAGGYTVEAAVEAGRESTLAAQVAGRILALQVDAGDSVKQGQLLARIDDSEVRQGIVGNRAQVAQAEANLANTQAQYERAKQLVARKFMSPASLDQAQAAYRAAQAQVAAARAGVAQASATRGFSNITAPFPGLVSARLAQVGEMASLGRPLLTLFDPSTLRVIASVPQEKLEAVRKSGRASIEFQAQTQWVESVSITVLPSADNLTHTSQVRIELPRTVTGIYPGMFARAHFSVSEDRKLMLPQAAILHRSEVTAVYVIKGEQVQLRQVRLGTVDAAGQVEILAGLEAGERIALEPVKAGMFMKKTRAGN